MGLWKLLCIQWIPCHREIQSGLNEQRIVIKSAASGCLWGPCVAATYSRSSALVFTTERGRDGEYCRKSAQSPTQLLSPPSKTEPNNAATGLFSHQVLPTLF